jgi:four helix bundle protein
MAFKFEKLEIWQQSLDYLDKIYRVANKLPEQERYNLKSQMIRAATSVNLNIAEGSTGQTDAEQARFLGLALRSLFETVACLHIIHRLNYLNDPEDLRQIYRDADLLARRITAMRKRLVPEQTWLREQSPIYQTAQEKATPFD